MNRIRLSTRTVSVLIVILLGVLSWDLNQRYEHIARSVETTRLDFLEDFTEILASILSSRSGSMLEVQRTLDMAYSEVRPSIHAEWSHEGLWVPETRISLWNTRGQKLFERPDQAGDAMSTTPLPFPIAALQTACLREAAYERDSGLTRITCPLSHQGQTLGGLSISRHDHRVQELVDSAQMTVLYLGVESAFMMLLGLVLVFCAILRPFELWQRHVRVLKAGKVPHQLRLDRTQLGPIGRMLDHLLSSITGDRYLKNYVHALTHQYQHPLQRLMNAVSTLEALYPDDERIDAISTRMHDELAAMTRFNRMVMALAKVEELEKLSSASRCALQDLVAEILESFQDTFAIEHIPVEYSLNPCTVWGDRYLIQEAIVNLLQNAIDFSRPGDLMTITLKPEGPKVELLIRDRGFGIPDYAEHQLFDRFFTTARKHRGTLGNGLGLTYVKEIMDLHGGEVTVTNHPEGGVEARLIFPTRN